jgi:hypothetical protein
MNMLQTKHLDPREMKRAAAAGEARDIGWLGCMPPGNPPPNFR